MSAVEPSAGGVKGQGRLPSRMSVRSGPGPPSTELPSDDCTVRKETARTREFLAALLIEMPGEPETLRLSLWEGGRSGDGDATLPSHAKTLGLAEGRAPLVLG